MDDEKREVIARAICDADPMAPDPDATIMIGMRTAKAWEARLPMADAVLSGLAAYDAKWAAIFDAIFNGEGAA